jgi:glycosyltransferase involved in cell wall biosynthesis
MPDVSIIIPVYNRVELLQEALLSCAIQTFGDCEVLVVDDGSEQDVAFAVEQTREVCGGSCHFRLIRQAHRGAPAARNRGVREAAGRFIQFLDSDDLLHPQKIEIQRQYLLDQPDLDMVFCLDEFFRRVPGDMGILWNTPGEPSLDRFLSEDTVWHTGSPLWRRHAVERVDAWDERLLCYQDWEYHIRALCRGVRYAAVSFVLQYIRDHDASRISTSNSLRERERAKIQAAELIAKELTKKSMWSRGRGDALAVFLLQCVLKTRGIDTLGHLMATLAKATRYAGSLRLRLAALLMLGAAVVTGFKKAGRRDSLQSVYELAKRFQAIPTYSSNWRRATCPSGEAPGSLLRALSMGLGGGCNVSEPSVAKS